MASESSKISPEACGAGQPAAGSRRVYIIDDDIDIRRSLHFLLSASDITAWPFSDAADFLDQVTTLAPAPILLDVRMPGISGIELLGMLQDRDVRWPVIVMTAHGDVPVAVRAMKLGAIEFLEKPFQAGMLDQALDYGFRVLEQVTASTAERDGARRRFALLTPREREVVDILALGVPNKLVADRLGLSARTVEMHRGKALGKLGLKSIAEVVALRAVADLRSGQERPIAEAG